MTSSAVKLAAFVSTLLFATVCHAVILDDFEDPWTDNYTSTHASGVGPASVAGGAGWTGLAAPGGSNLGKVDGVHPGNFTFGFLWNGPETVSIGDTVAIWTSSVSGAYGGGGMVLKTIPGGAYVVGIGDDGGNAKIYIGTHDLLGGGGGPLLYGAAAFGAHSSALKTLVGLTGQFFKLVATITAPDEFTTQIDVDLYSGSVGSEVFLNSYQYIDVISSALDHDPGQPGLLTSHWNNSGTDLDNLELVTTVAAPEPATVALLAAGGLATTAGGWRRRRR